MHETIDTNRIKFVSETFFRCRGEDDGIYREEEIQTRIYVTSVLKKETYQEVDCFVSFVLKEIVSTAFDEVFT